MKLTPLLIILFLSCTKQSNENNNILNIALTTEIPTLDHATSYDTVSAQVVYQIHEPLLEYEYLIRPYTLKPLLASEMPKVKNDGLTFLFNIKKNIYYHQHPAFHGNKREVKAQDFVNQIKRIAIDSQSNAFWLFENIKGIKDFKEKASNYGDIFKYEIEGIKVLSDYKFEIELIKKQPQFIYAFAMSFTAPSPKEIIDHYKNDLSLHPIGTGPFYFKKWNRGLSLILDRFENYHKHTYPQKGDRYAFEKKLLNDSGLPLPFIDGIKFHIIKEAQTRWLNFLKNKIDIITLTKDHFSVALKNGELTPELKKKGYHLQIAPTLTYWWLAFNMQDKLLGQNLKLRQAIAHAVDFEKYIELFTNNIGLIANSIYPPGIPGYNPSASLPYNYNIEKAKQLLKDAGFPNGKGLPVLRYDLRGVSNVSRQSGEFIKAELDKIGIKVEVIQNTFSAFLNKAQTGQLQFWQGGWAMDYPDAENIIQLLTSKSLPPGPNASYYMSAQVDQLYDQLQELNFNENQSLILEQIENIINQDLPWIMMFYSRNYVLHNNRVFNFRQSDIIYSTYKYLRLKK